jgi:polysaccharide export outer membrane protein
VEERGEWVRVAAEERQAAEAAAVGEPPLYVERIIEIPYERLERGESKYNIIVRPSDRIFVEPPESGLVYIEGQIVRPGPYALPANSKLTLSRLVATAGGLGQLAIPEKVDLIRMVGDNREAAIRVNLGAIRHRTEPDILLKPDDHIIIGTSWFATPLAVIRNGFRMTYGFGFLLDRNFGNDVFGAPPGSWGTQ